MVKVILSSLERTATLHRATSLATILSLIFCVTIPPLGVSAVFKPGENNNVNPEEIKRHKSPDDKRTLSSPTANNNSSANTTSNDSSIHEEVENNNTKNATNNVKTTNDMNLWLISGGVALVLVIASAIVWRLKKR